MKTIREIIKEARREAWRQMDQRNEGWTGPYGATIMVELELKRRLGPTILDLRVSPSEEER